MHQRNYCGNKKAQLPVNSALSNEIKRTSQALSKLIVRDYTCINSLWREKSHAASAAAKVVQLFARCFPDGRRVLQCVRAFATRNRSKLASGTLCKHLKPCANLSREEA